MTLSYFANFEELSDEAARRRAARCGMYQENHEETVKCLDDTGESARYRPFEDKSALGFSQFLPMTYRFSRFFTHFGLRKHPQVSRGAADELRRTPCDRAEFPRIAVWLSATALVGTVNAVQVIRRVGHDVRPSTRSLIHAYDFGFFLYLGLTLALISVVANASNRKWQRVSGTIWATGAVSVVGAAIGVFALPRDLMNFIDRVQLPVSASVLSAFVGAVAFGSWSQPFQGAD